MRCFIKSLVAVLFLGIFVLFAPSVYYRYTHWPRDVDFTKLVAFADQQLQTSSADPQVPEESWLEAVRKLKPTNVYLDRTDSCMIIVLNHGGVFRGDTEFSIVPSGYTPEKISPNDVILPTRHPSVFRVDRKY